MTLAIYTCVIGAGYELPTIPERDNLEYICFTDQENLKGNGWQIHAVEPILKDDPARSSRDPKIRPHLWLKKHRRSIYIDPSVLLRVGGRRLWSNLIPRSDLVFGCFEHSFRATLEDEYREIKSYGLDTALNLSRLRKMTRAVYGKEVFRKKPYWGGIIARRHHDPSCIHLMERWYALVMKYSRRDQLSLPLIIQDFPSDKVHILKFDIFESRLHSWPAPGYARPSHYFQFDQAGR